MNRSEKQPFFASCLALIVLSMISVSAYCQEEDQPKNDIMIELERYLGDWISDVRKDPSEREFRFSYHLDLYDQRGNMVKMVIRKEYSDGEVKILWEGFKGWHPVKKVVYYHGFSPSGRAGAGELRKSGELLLTEYEGFDGRGNGVQLRDTFTPLSPDSFRSETNILRDGKWQSINIETWNRRKQ